ncbi:MAG: DUF393 domain-containing protein, partial [Caldilineae bacterium]
PPMTSSLRRACTKAVHVLTADGRVLRGGRATLFVLAEVGIFPRLMAVLAHPPLLWLVEGAYRLVARYRARLTRWF